MAAAFKLGSRIRELRIQLCQKSKESEGVREFMKKHYVLLKRHNVRFPILVRECSGVRPVLFARYALGKESSIPLGNLSADQVLKKIYDLSQSSNK